MDRALEKTLADLEKEEWYHGHLPYEDIVGLMKNDGDFLLRGLEPEGEHNAMVCLSVKWEGKVRDFPVHYMLRNNERVYTLDGTVQSNDIMELIKYYLSSAKPAYEVILKKPICKQPWELTIDKIRMVQIIGSGAFGEVWRGTMQEGPSKPPVDVAIKMKKVNEENKALMEAMYREARLMRQYKHKNLVAFYGVVQKSADDVMIVMEFIDGGCLKDHIKKNNDISVRTKIGFGIDVAVGLVYLHSKSCMHRDIACRNCLIDVKKNIVKISDFGASKQAEFYKIPETEKIPIRWQAPEVVLTRVYTMESDVYSYGILLWEIFNNGETPYKGIGNKEIRLKVANPKYRPRVDDSMPVLARRVMKACWRGNPKKRPKMSQVARYLIHAPQDLLLPKSALNSEAAKKSGAGRSKSGTAMAQASDANQKAESRRCGRSGRISSCFSSKKK